LTNSGNLCQFKLNSLAPCQYTGCKNGGTCTILNKCQCATGFYGTFCEISNISTLTTKTDTRISKLTILTTTSTSITTTKPCPSNIANICQNNASCIININGYFCKCINGYSGIFCNILPFSNGTTITNFKKLTTTTTISLTKTTNSVSLDQSCPPSLANLCKNNSTCIYSNQMNSSLCRCLPSFSGLYIIDYF
jgi:hypothetical protein